MPSDGVQTPPPPSLPLRVGDHTLDDLPRLRNAPGRIDYRALEFSQQRRPIVGRTAQHHPVQPVAQVSENRRGFGETAIDDDGQRRTFTLESMHILVLERGDLPVF